MDIIFPSLYLDIVGKCAPRKSKCELCMNKTELLFLRDIILFISNHVNIPDKLKESLTFLNHDSDYSEFKNLFKQLFSKCKDNSLCWVDTLTNHLKGKPHAHDMYAKLRHMKNENFRPRTPSVFNGFKGLFLINSHSSLLIPNKKRFGSYEGEEYIATTSPV